VRPPLAGRRILVTADAVGGVWRYALDLAAGLARRDVAVTLLGIGPGPGDDQRAEAARAGVGLLWLDDRLDWTLRDAQAAAGLAADMAGRASDAGADLVHVNQPALAGTDAFAMPVVAASHSCLATWWRAMRGTRLPGDWQWHRRLTGRGLARARAAIAPSAAFAADLVAVYGPLPGLAVVPNATRPVLPLPRGAFVLAAGRWWDEAKNFAVLDAAAARIDWPILAAGALRGPDGAAVRPAHLRALGRLDAAAMAEVTGRAPIAVSLSLYEPFGLSVLEAASAGAALVLSDIPTFRELWGGAALFVDPRDPGDVARAINGLIRDPRLRERLGADAAARAARYGQEDQIDAMIGIYARALGLPALPVSGP
jgi:glycosyltransferase involved in cell wall biosynthesis